MPQIRGAGSLGLAGTRGAGGVVRYKNFKARLMSMYVWLTLGVVTGYLGSLMMRCEAKRDAVMTTGAGILGALLSGWLLSPLLGQSPDRGFFSATAVAIALLGAVVLVALVNFLRYRRIR